MSPSTAFNVVLGLARHELELSIFQGIVHQSSLSCCPDCRTSMTTLLTLVSQQHKSTAAVPTTQLDTHEIFSYDARQQVIIRRPPAGSQPADSFVRPRTTHFSVAKALYLDIQSSIPSGVGGFPTWHETVLVKWVNTMGRLGGAEARWYADRFLFEVLMFEYTHFFKVGDDKDLFVEMFTANEETVYCIDENGEEVMDCIVVAVGEEDENDDDDYKSSGGEDGDEDVDMEDADEGESAPVPDVAHTSLNEASCTMLAQSYLARVNTFLLPTNQLGMTCGCPDYLEFKLRLTTTRRKTYSFGKIFRAMFLKQLGATDTMAYGELDFQEKAGARTKEEVVETVVDDLAYALGHGEGERWFWTFQQKFFAGKNVKEGKYADEIVVLNGGPRWGLADGRLGRLQ